MTTAWSREHLAELRDSPPITGPLIRADEVARVLPDHDVWDLWPVREPDGAVSTLAGELWLGLSAPVQEDPVLRHDVARIRLLGRRDGAWSDLGAAFPDGASLGSREWAGSAVHDAGHETVTVFYTAAGWRGEQHPTFVQRIAQATARIEIDGARPRLSGWCEHRQSVEADGEVYQRALEEKGEPGFIKAFRDPAFFRDPATRCDHLLFTASLARARTDFNGAIGIAEAAGDGWSLLPPLVHADGVNNELERPHVVLRDGLYYLFFSTQRRTFHPDVTGPTGLYGFVAPSLHGPYEALNGSGLVFANPPEEPMQAYSWLVLNDLRVISFVDMIAGRFGGTVAPFLRIGLEGSHAWLAGSAEEV